MDKNASPTIKPGVFTQAVLFDGILAEGLNADQWREIAHKLWGILDDIDTLSDAMKPDETPFYKATMRLANKRHWHLVSDGFELRLPQPGAELVGVDAGGTVYPPTQEAESPAMIAGQ